MEIEGTTFGTITVDGKTYFRSRTASRLRSSSLRVERATAAA
jgi:hypothetical protein